MTIKSIFDSSDASELDTLFPGEVINIGKISVTIKPLTFKQIALLLKKSKTLVSNFDKVGITKDNFSEGQNILIIVSDIMEQAPSILEDVLGISESDLQKLPLDVIVSLATTAIEVNLKSKDTLIKNFKGLVEKFQQIQLNPSSESKKDI